VISKQTMGGSPARADSGRQTYQLLLVLVSVIFLLLPLVTTFNEILTTLVIRLGLDEFLRAWVVPVEARMIAALVRLIGISTAASQTSVYLTKGANTIPIYISWNCVGWQSFILFAITLVTGLQGCFTWRSKAEVVILGFLGTFLVNLLRISLVCVVAYYAGQLPAVVFHDYGGSSLILLWLFGFWYFAHGCVLESPERPEESNCSPAT
jgi:exosortase/archaeosortase family protein